ncbi:MAG: hypothetical protein LBR16_04025 [Treponema sp.]|jgi:hypothetical protein|nr:hypothetical protein [Treponema sp.]
MTKTLTRAPALLCAAALLAGCLGAQAEVTLKKDGSGTVTLEYRIAKALDELGAFDGNERWLSVPVGRADVERGLKRLSGVSLRSFSSHQDDRDTIVNMTLRFESPAALAALLDSGGTKAVYSEAGGVHQLLLRVAEEQPAPDPALGALLAEAAAGYSLGFTLHLPSEGKLLACDASGGAAALPEGAALVGQGRTVSFNAPLEGLAGASKGLLLTVEW